MRRSTVLPVLVAVAAVSGIALARRKPALETHARDLTGAPFPLKPSGRRSAGTVASARLVPPTWEPRPLTALGEWEPAPPRTPLARAAAYVWAAPLSAAGLLVGLTSRVRPRARDGVLLFAPARGLAGEALRRRRFAAATLGHVVVAVREPSASLLAHELVHVRQAERLGPLLAPLYGVLAAVYGYARNPLERAPRAASRREREARTRSSA